MQNFGRTDISTYFTNLQPIPYQTGMNWEYITVINESPYMLSLNFAGVGSIDFPAWFKDDIPMSRGYVGSFTIIPTLLTTGQLGTPSTIVTVNAWIPGELTNPQPVALSRLTNVGNVINTVGGVASSVQNDNNPSGTSVVEATVQGDSASAVSLVNNGHLLLGTTANDGFLQVITSAGAHKLIFDTAGNLTIDKGILANLITALTGNDIGFHVATGQRVVVTVNGVDIFQANDNGISVLPGGGGVFYPLPTAQALATGNTILIPGVLVRVSVASNVTGIIMTPGSVAGQIIHLYNQGGGGSLTFAASGSNVRGGSNILCGNGKLLTMVWDGSNWATNGPLT
jgi:hypothetical protein